MSEENVEVVRRMTEIAERARRAGDPGAGFDECVAQGLISPDLEVRAGFRGGTGIAGLADAVGRDAYDEFVRRFTEDFDDLQEEYEEFIDAGDDRVLVLGHASATGKGSGVPVEMPLAGLFELDTRCVVRVTLFLTHESAVKAAGLQE